MLKVHRLQNTQAEIIEVVLLGKQEHAHIIQQPLSKVDFPSGCHVLGIIRQNELYQPQAQFRLKQHDHLLILVLDHHKLEALESLFQLPSH